MMALFRAIFRPDITARAIVLFILKLKKINDMDLDNDLKVKIRRSYIVTFLNTFLLKRFDAHNRVAWIGGYSVHFLEYNSLIILFNEIFQDQEYCFQSDKENPYIIDCGSNIGMSILYYKLIYPNSEILAFEPFDEAFQCLERNIVRNRVQGVKLYQKALTAKEGEVGFFYDPDNPGSLIMSTKEERMSKANRVVGSVRLSNYIDRVVDFMKIDVEGAEVDLIEDLSSEGKLSYVKQMVIEYHHHIHKDHDVLSHMLKMLEDAKFGYQIESHRGRPHKSHQFQNILIYAYKKEPSTCLSEGSDVTATQHGTERV